MSGEQILGEVVSASPTQGPNPPRAAVVEGGGAVPLGTAVGSRAPVEPDLAARGLQAPLVPLGLNGDVRACAVTLVRTRETLDVLNDEFTPSGRALIFRLFHLPRMCGVSRDSVLHAGTHEAVRAFRTRRAREYEAANDFKALSLVVLYGLRFADDPWGQVPYVSEGVGRTLHGEVVQERRPFKRVCLVVDRCVEIAGDVFDVQTDAHEFQTRDCEGRHYDSVEFWVDAAGTDELGVSERDVGVPRQVEGAAVRCGVVALETAALDAETRPGAVDGASVSGDDVIGDAIVGGSSLNDKIEDIGLCLSVGCLSLSFVQRPNGHHLNESAHTRTGAHTEQMNA